MREPPPHLSDEDVLALVHDHWPDHRPDHRAARADHLPVGFGAHHWKAGDLFVTFDRLEPKRSGPELEAAYAGAAALAEAGLEFVLASLRSRHGTFTVPAPEGALSCTPWREDGSMGPFDVATTASMLARLHATAPPPGLPRWAPLVGEDLADELAALTSRAWGPGPYADAAREAVRERLADVARWTSAYHRLADAAGSRPWVPTHGEPHEDNQLVTPTGHLLIDWESLELAPAERDLRALVEAGATDTGADPAMVEMFDLEWRLDEVGQYAAWFAAPHTGTASDEVAFGGLLHELRRPG